MQRRSAVNFGSQAYSGHVGSEPTSTLESTGQHSLSSDRGRPSYTSLAHLSLIPNKTAAVSMDRQQAVQIDQLWQGSSSAFEPPTHAFDHGTREYNLSTMNPKGQPASPSATIDHHHIQYSQNKPDNTLLQVPTTTKRQRTADNHQDRRTPIPEKRYKVSSSALAKPTMPHPVNHQIPAEPHSPNDQNLLQEIRNVAKNYSGDSEVFISSINRVLNGVIDEDQHEQQKRLDVPDDDAPDTKKPIECDQCHKRMARQCDLR